MRDANEHELRPPVRERCVVQTAKVLSESRELLNRVMSLLPFLLLCLFDHKQGVGGA